MGGNGSDQDPLARGLMPPEPDRIDTGDAPVSNAAQDRRLSERGLETAGVDDTLVSIPEQVRPPRDFSMSQLLQVFGAVAAPTGLVVGCLYYFGYVSTREHFRYFAIDPEMLGLSTTDYLRNSVSPLFVPLIGLTLVALVVVVGHLVLRRMWQPTKNPGRSWLLPAMVAVAGILTCVQYRVRLFEPPFLKGYGMPFPRIYIVPAIALLSYAAYLYQRWLVANRRSTLWPESGSIVPYLLLGLTVCLIALSLFLAVNDYAVKHGESSRMDLATYLRQKRPAVRVYSTTRLRLHNPDVREESLPGRDNDYRFCYTGLRLLIWSNDRHFLLPEDWGVGNRVTIILPDNNTTRVELIGEGESKATCP
jgi:hypothetical protein